jgi:hypothetical protein
MKAQGYGGKDNVLFQDNKSSIFLEKNGKASSSKRTKHIHIRYFFITARVRRGKYQWSGALKGTQSETSRLIPSKGLVKLLPLPQPPMRARTDARTNPSAQRATQLRSVLARVYAVSIQNQITSTVP